MTYPQLSSPTLSVGDTGTRYLSLLRRGDQIRARTSCRRHVAVSRNKHHQKKEVAGVYLKQRDLCDQAKWSSQRWVQHESLCTIDLGNCKRSHVKKTVREGKGLTELSACTREFLAISRSTETSTASLASRRWSELDEVEVDMSRSVVRPVARCGVLYVQFHIMLCTVHVLIISCFSSHSSLSSSLRSHLFLLCILTGAFLPLPTLLVSL